MSGREAFACAALVLALVFTFTSCEDTVGTVTLYPQPGNAAPGSGVANEISVGRCTRNTSPPDAVSSFNRSGYFVAMYLTYDCSGPPTVTLYPFGQTPHYLPTHGPINSVRGLELIIPESSG